MKSYLVFLIVLIAVVNFINAQDSVIPPKIEEEIYIKIKKFEGPIDVSKNIEEILRYDHKYVEEIIFRKLDEIESKKPASLNQIINILGNFESNRTVLTLAKFAEPYLSITDKEKLIPRPRHIRISAINALIAKPTEERIKIILKHVNDNDTIFQCLVFKLLKEKKVKESIEPVFAVFKNANSETMMNVKTDAASLIIDLCDDPQLKSNVLLNMLMDTSIHIRKAGFTLLPEGGLAGDSEIRRQIKEILKTAKDEELELACKGVGTIRLKDAKDEVITILEREKSPLLKWQCLHSLFRINHDAADINKRIQELIKAYTVNPNIKNADQERFLRLQEIINTKE